MSTPVNPLAAAAVPVEVIMVRTDQGIVKVRAGIYGPLAVHIATGGECYVVTHVKLGLRVHPFNLTRDQAIAIAEKLSQNRLWDFANDAEFVKRKPMLQKSLDAVSQEVGV
jgi:hypothetical protein